MSASPFGTQSDNPPQRYSSLSHVWNGHSLLCFDPYLLFAILDLNLRTLFFFLPVICVLCFHCIWVSERSYIDDLTQLSVFPPLDSCEQSCPSLASELERPHYTSTSLNLSSWWKHADMFVKVLVCSKEMGYYRWRWSGPQLLTFDLYPWWHTLSLFNPSEIKGSRFFCTIKPSACLHNRECYRFCVWKRTHE